MNKSVELSLIPFFSGLSRDRLAEIEGFSMVQTFEKKAIVFQSNEPARNIYGLIKGEVSLSILFKEEIVTKDIKHEDYISTHVEMLEKPVVIEKVKALDIFGWSALVQPEKMTATARCEDDCEIVLLPASHLKQLFSRDPELGYLLSARISSIIAHRLNSRTQKLVDAWCSLYESGQISMV